MIPVIIIITILKQISEEDIDYFKMMNYEGGEVTPDNEEILHLLEEDLSYPPRFQLQFQSVPDAYVITQNVKVKFNGIAPPTTFSIILQKSGIYKLINCIKLHQNQQAVVGYP